MPFKRIFIFIIFISTAYCGFAQQEYILTSPNNINSIKFFIQNGKPCYTVQFQKALLLDTSALGLQLKETDLSTNMVVEKIAQRSFNETWKPVWGISETIKNNYNELTVSLYNKETKIPLKIIFRAFDDGIAFRYELPANNKFTDFIVTEELSSFNFADDLESWSIPADVFAYEGLYVKAPVSKLTHVNTPITFEGINGNYFAIHEAALYDYSEMTLMRDKKNIKQLNAFLWTDSNACKVAASLPFVTPWRYLQTAASLEQLVTSGIEQNLNEPCRIDDVSWIKPMKFVGIWWSMHTKEKTWYAGASHGANTIDTKKYIDFAAKHNMGGVLAEGWNEGWETWQYGKMSVQNYVKPYPDFDLDEVVKYGKSKNVEFISHFETGGNIPMFEQQIDTAFAFLHKLNIVALKTGYAGSIIPKGNQHHGQYMVRHFQKVVELAAKNHVMLDVHEPIKPTGIDRTYPNLLSQ